MDSNLWYILGLRTPATHPDANSQMPHTSTLATQSQDLTLPHITSKADSLAAQPVWSMPVFFRRLLCKLSSDLFLWCPEKTILDPSYWALPRLCDILHNCLTYQAPFSMLGLNLTAALFILKASTNFFPVSKPSLWLLLFLKKSISLMKSSRV